MDSKSLYFMWFRVNYPATFQTAEYRTIATNGNWERKHNMVSCHLMDLAVGAGVYPGDDVIDESVVCEY